MPRAPFYWFIFLKTDTVLFSVLCIFHNTPVSASFRHVSEWCCCIITEPGCFDSNCNPNERINKIVTELMLSLCSSIYRTAAEGDIIDISGFQLCSAKQLTNCTSESKPGLETKTALTSHKYLLSGSKYSECKSSEMSLLPLEIIWIANPYHNCQTQSQLLRAQSKPHSSLFRFKVI